MLKLHNRMDTVSGGISIDAQRSAVQRSVVVPVGGRARPQIRDRRGPVLPRHIVPIPSCLVLLSQTESPRRSFVSADSAHGRDSRQDQELP